MCLLFTQESDTWSGCRQFADVGVLLQGHGCLGSSQTAGCPCTLHRGFSGSRGREWGLPSEVGVSMYTERLLYKYLTSNFQVKQVASGTVQFHVSTDSEENLATSTDTSSKARKESEKPPTPSLSECFPCW